MASQGSRSDALDSTIGGTREAPLPGDDKLSELLRRLRTQLTAVETGRIQPDEEGRFTRKHLAELESQIAALSSQLEDAQSASAATKVQLSSVIENYDRLKSHRLVRFLLLIARRLRTMRRFVSPANAWRQVKDRIFPPANRLTRHLKTSRSAATSASTSSVSIVIPTRNGADMLARLLDALEHTSYEYAEVIVIDNGSTDQTAEVIAGFSRWPIQHIKNDQNTAFSLACNQGADAATGAHVLFLNNDIEPINDSWLGTMVDALESDSTVVAAGALLIYPDGRHTRDPKQAPLTIQHRGIAFTWHQGHPRPVNLGIGESPLSVDASDIVEVPAATAACLLVEASALAEADAFSVEYEYGWEDSDLCMKLREKGGRVVVAYGAALFHHEFGTQDSLDPKTRYENYTNNTNEFVRRWSPRLRRLYQSDLLAGRRFWAANTTGSIAITVTDFDEGAGFGDWYTAHELGDALESLGWNIEYIEKKNDAWHTAGVAVDIVIALLPSYDPRSAPSGALTVAWVRNWVDRWIENPAFDDYTTVFASTELFAARIELQTTQRAELMPLATNPRRFARQSSRPDLECDVAVAANVWGEHRKVFDSLDVRDSDSIKVFGRGWEGSEAEPHWQGPIEYKDLPALYSSASIVLDDTVGPNMPALNGRVFDAIATGTLVITDNAHGSEEWFGGLLPAWSDPAELRSQVDHFLTASDERGLLVRRLQKIVLEHHTYEQRADQIVASLKKAVARPEIALRISPRTADQATLWGDTYFALDMARALRRHGFRTSITVRALWDDAAHQSHDVVLSLRGIHRYTPKSGALNILWVISHPADITEQEVAAFDLVFVAGEPLLEKFRVADRADPRLLHQATDPNRFRPGDPDPTLATDVLFVGNSRGVERPAIRLAVAAGLSLTVYGQDWEDRVPARYLASDTFPNDRLPALYQSANVVLNDHWPDMARAGIISNRVFDVLACETPLVTDDVAGLRSVLGDDLWIFSDADDFAQTVEQATTTGEGAAERRAALSVVVRERHTFDVRARVLAEAIDEAVSSGLGSPDWPDQG